MTRFSVDSGQPCGLYHNTRNSLEYTESMPKANFFFMKPEDERDAIKVMKGVDAWLCHTVATREVGTLWDDFACEVTHRVITTGVHDSFDQIRNKIPWFETTLDEGIRAKVADCLLRGYSNAFADYITGKPSPFRTMGSQAQLDLELQVAEIFADNKAYKEHAARLAKEITELFWDLSCMVVHPEHYDFPWYFGGRRVRKSLPPAIVAPPPAVLPIVEQGNVPLFVEGLCSIKKFIGRFSVFGPEKLRRYLTTTMHPNEVATLREGSLCPRYWLVEGGEMVPSDSFLCSLATGDRDSYYSCSEAISDSGAANDVRFSHKHYQGWRQAERKVRTDPVEY